ncbi:MAG: arginine deiminase [Bacteroidetes bacterium]|nr:arginine deiminase [Bacteroidota bacterium]MBU1578806.1 arginine deiminase [Bacteroidota bacterium]MBU2556852.1 arginine deiminase [Bacteroidota bacterium]
MSADKININVHSEIGELEAVIIHTPGPEVENMTPENAARALYSDILNLSVALPEYNEFKAVLEKVARVFDVKDLLNDILTNEKVKASLISRICRHESVEDACTLLGDLNDVELARQLIEGVEMHKNTLTKYLDNERYSLHPLPNFFFTRDASFSMNDKVMISHMASKVREREALIMEAIFDYHPAFSTQTVNPVKSFDRTGKATIEGGDVIIAREDVFLSGISGRTSSQGIDALLEYLKTKPGTKHLILQELPYQPESFIHLDMVFTFLDKDKCMIFEPLILHSSRHLTIHIIIEESKVVQIKEEKNILDSLKKLGMDLEPVLCGGANESFIMEREQWQSGANFFAIAPGKIIGYGRNTYTMNELNRHGFEVIKAKDVIKERVKIEDYAKYVITIEGDELSRGGGGARCMTMPISRKDVDW